ncbi:AAHS family 4-hydroxybenzoate transporter-like MFS transporter [Chromobacterium alkanivorans]|uniref:MFS transporter n=1 Tax=Chromobacterium alkanivorans TaxID=1071719 RepID=UPI002167E9C9|nr:MFS transporter [Chromobacterium alkanivorans]MCS3806842.1 AAHS family 4-hydroxybenzoate transporter-like MFS transporter [Chromobacterium alkanivorans]MCS3821190.1 AAHS family 4-hydroxybenzoate transporter-like MFS transporter [Chromobacterium alkanivorans]MCS3876179.1 AAHS family 4-hydroxybenzoate transporter-like MFS transporter [Chromobacterium alkanivorans]
MKATLSIPGLIDQEAMSALQWRVLVLCFLIALFDGFDTQAMAFTGPAILDAFKLQSRDLAPILTAGIVGMVFGAMMLGQLGDKIGRRPAAMLGVAVFGAATLLTASATETWQILALRFIAGLGMGGCTPVVLALAAEYTPARWRGAVVTGVLLGLPAGAMLGGLLAAKMLPVIGWQGIFIIGGTAPLLLLLALAVLLPESLHFKAVRGDEAGQRYVAKTLARIVAQPLPADIRFTLPEDASIHGSVRGLFADGYARKTLAIWSVYLLNWVAWFMLLSWLPTVLKTAGLPTAQAPMGTFVVNLAFIVFAVPLSYLLPRLSIRSLLIAMFALGVATALGLGYAGANWTLVFLLLGLAGLGVGGQQLALNYWVISVYPTALRATASGWSIGMGRAGAIIGSAVGGSFLSWLGPAGFFMVLAIPLLGALLAVLMVEVQSPSESRQGGFS